MTEDDLMLLINDYAAAYNRTNSKIDRAAAREILAAIQAYGDGRAELALETAAEGRNDFFWPTGPLAYR